MADTKYTTFGAGLSDAAKGKGPASTQGLPSIEKESYDAGYSKGKK